MPSVSILKILPSFGSRKRLAIPVRDWPILFLLLFFMIACPIRAQNSHSVLAAQKWWPEAVLQRDSKSGRLYLRQPKDESIEPASDLEYSSLLMPIENGDANMSNEPIANLTTNSSSDGLYEIPPSIVVLLCIMYISVSLIAVCGNLMVFYVCVVSKKMRNITNMFIANLALADVLIGSLSIPFQFIAALLQRWLLPDVFCQICPTVSSFPL